METGAAAREQEAVRAKKVLLFHIVNGATHCTEGNKVEWLLQ
jgi:hypothetical protein